MSRRYIQHMYYHLILDLKQKLHEIHFYFWYLRDAKCSIFSKCLAIALSKTNLMIITLIVPFMNNDMNYE